VKLRTVIVDDEPLARQRIRDLLANESVEIVGECEDGLQALQLIRDAAPDLVFLDVQMPGLDGFEVLNLLDERPAIIFTTAFDAYAVRAFDEHALDYLLKPIDAARFADAMARVRRPAPPDERREAQPLRRVVVKTPGRVLFLETRDVDWFEAAGNYVRVHSGGEKHLVRMTMQTLEQRLDPRAFVRVHRSIIVNVNRVAALNATFRGEYDVVLKSGETVSMQRSYHDRLRAALGDF
jgi:two-component system LytT family response regulator